MIYSSSLNMDQPGSKTRSPGQIKGKLCKHSRGHNVFTIFLLLSQNVNLNNINVKFEYGFAWVKN